MFGRFDHPAITVFAVAMASLALGSVPSLVAWAQPPVEHVETTDNAGMGTGDPAMPEHAATATEPAGSAATGAPAGSTAPQAASEPARPADPRAIVAQPLPDAASAEAAIPDAMTSEPPAAIPAAPAAIALPSVRPAPDSPEAVTAAPLPDVAPAAPEPAVAAQPAPEAPAASAALDKPPVQPAAPAAVNVNPADPTPADAQAMPETVAQPATPPADAAPPVSATPPAVAASPEPPAADPVAQKLAELLTGPNLGKFLALKPEQEAVAAFYGARADKPVFTAGSSLSPLGTAVLAQFAASAADGLSPSDYAVAPLAAGASDEAVAETELRLAAATLLYARHIQSGRFDPGRISAGVTPLRTPPDPAAVLNQLSAAADPRAVLATYAPQYEGYRRLKARLGEMRAELGSVPPPQVPQGRVLRPNMEDPRVPLLRTRLGVQGDAESLTYDHDLVEAVKAFQKKVDQPANGIVGKATIASLNDTGEARIGDIVANMERWRWLPHDVAPNYVMVNIPEFLVRIYKDGKEVHETKVVVGKPENPTPLLTHDMEYIVFNPSWNVPPGIARKEMLPRLAADPYYLARQGIDVVRNGRAVDPGSVDWSRGTQGYSFRQPPGERNALGRIKFMFPNKHSVYLHDTPSRSLFANARRAYSHGCVRVFEPLKFGEVIFSLGMPQDPWSQTRISKQLGGSERYVNLKQRFPVHLVYFTSFVDDDGDLVTREDLYGINAQTKLLLGLDGARRVADRGTAPTPRP